MEELICQKKVCLVAALILLTTVLSNSPVAGQINCAELAHWSATNPPVNQTHVFCGEYTNKPKGFHSRPGGLDPETIGNAVIGPPANAQGIYGIQWSYAGHPARTKFSTMFPDACTQQEVLNSVAYAAMNPVQCPVHAPNWAWCGYNHPHPIVGGPFCQAANDVRFYIAGASLGNGNVNTAFPLM